MWLSIPIPFYLRLPNRPDMDQVRNPSAYPVALAEARLTINKPAIGSCEAYGSFKRRSNSMPRHNF